MDLAGCPTDCMDLADCPTDCMDLADCPMDCMDLADCPMDCMDLNDRPTDCMVLNDRPTDCMDLVDLHYIIETISKIIFQRMKATLYYKLLKTLVVTVVLNLHIEHGYQFYVLQACD